jgi:hypothetical protein
VNGRGSAEREADGDFEEQGSFHHAWQRSGSRLNDP